MNDITQLSTLYSNAIARAEKAEELVAEYRDHSNPYWQDRAEKAEEALRKAYEEGWVDRRGEFKDVDEAWELSETLAALRTPPPPVRETP